MAMKPELMKRMVKGPDGVEFEVALSQQSDPTRLVEFDCADAHLHRAPTRFAKAFLRSAVARPWVATG